MLNATIKRRVDVTPELIIFGVVPDAPVEDFEPGQYAALGLLGSAARPAGFPPEKEVVPPHKLVKRAYSVCSSPANKSELEFYIGILPLGALTSRLMNAKPGDRIFVTEKITGTFTLTSLAAEVNLILVATGTGIAPYVSMLRTPSTWIPGRRITLLHSVRESRELAYREEFEGIAKTHSDFTYIPTVTRDDPSWSGSRGRIQTLMKNNAFAADPATDHVFLCGNSPAVSALEKEFLERGFALHRKKSPGNIHEEIYD
jgi:ferredoxin/flavodoxin---NADP+ reductase